jgi:serine protease Do
MQTTVRRLALLALVSLVVSAGPAGAQGRATNQTNRVHMFSKPAVVRIYAGYVGQFAWKERAFDVQYLGSGSGFLIHPTGYILTNAHVVSDIKEGDEHGQRLLLRQLAVQVLGALGQPVNQQTLTAAMKQLAAEAQLTQFKRVNLVFLQSGSRFPFEIKAYGAPVGQGKDVAVVKIEVKNAPTLSLGDSDQMEVGDRLYVIGYPAAGDSPILDQKSELEPTTNDGHISAKKSAADGAPILQTNASTTHGNSGGPVLNEKGEVIGLLTFRGDTVNNQEVQGFNFIVPINTAQEFVRQAGTQSTVSPIDAKWHEGLEQYWAGRYNDSKQSLSAVVALYPDHSEARKLMNSAEERIVKGEDKSSSGLSVALSAALVLGGGLVLLGGGIAGVMLMRRSKVATPSSRSTATTATPSLESQPPRPAPSAHGSGSYEPTALFDTSVLSSKLVGVAGPLAGQEIPIGAGVVLGRDPARAQVLVNDVQVSGQHVWVGPSGGRIVARDSGSKNGTFLNEDQVNGITEVELKPGDTLTLGGGGSVKFQLTR